MSVIKMTDLDLAGKRVLIRQDLNVPIKDGKVTSDKRIQASLPTIEFAMNAGAKVMVMSHLGRPTEGEYDEQFSLIPVGEHMAALLTGSMVSARCEMVKLFCARTYALMPVRKTTTKRCRSRWLRCVISS